jgi:threonine dehydrogenase-like Zn-dependent dehydrogenase
VASNLERQLLFGAPALYLTPEAFILTFQVGLMSAYSAILQGASKVYVVDRIPERLAKVKEIGAIPIDFSKSDPVKQIIDQNDKKEVDRGIDAVGYQAAGDKDPSKEKANAVLSALISVVKPTGGLGIPGLYVPADPGAADEQSKEGNLILPFGKFFEKGLSMGTGQCNVKAYNRYLRDLIIAGRAKPGMIISHEIGLEQAPDAYEKFDKRVEGYTKVIIHPNN